MCSASRELYPLILNFLKYIKIIQESFFGLLPTGLVVLQKGISTNQGCIGIGHARFNYWCVFVMGPNGTGCSSSDEEHHQAGEGEKDAIQDFHFILMTWLRYCLVKAPP